VEFDVAIATTAIDSEGDQASSKKVQDFSFK